MRMSSPRAVIKERWRVCRGFLSLCGLFLLLSAAGRAQVASDTLFLRAQVVDFNSGQPLPHAQVGIDGKGIGTVAGADGWFSLPLAEALRGDTLSIGLAGYQSLRMPVAVVQNWQLPVALSPSEQTRLAFDGLQPGRKSRYFGHFTQSGVVQTGFNPGQLGREYGVMMRAKKPTLLETIQINFGKCTFDSVYFRLQVYRVQDGQFESMLSAPQYYAFSKYELMQTLGLDISDLGLVVTSDFLVSIEYYRDLGEGKLMFNSLVGKPTWVRSTSFDDWKKINLGISLGAYGRLLR